MMNKNERMNKLANAGIDTGKYFNINLPEGLAPGATISVVINENGQLVIAENKHDVIAEQIISDGYVRNTKLHRRFVMAQMFQMLSYKSYDGHDEGFHGYLNRMYAYDYTFNMMLDEVKVLSKLEVRDFESFQERSHFFTKEVILEVMNDYVKKLKEHIEKMPNKKCKGVPYKRINGQDIFVEDLDKKIYRPLCADIVYVRYAKNYTEIYNTLNNFMKNMVKLPYYTPKSKEWIDAFKGEGAYYTLKNLIMFHDCGVEELYLAPMVYGMTAMNYVKHKLDTYHGEGWRMFALMKKVISDNGISTKTYIAEVCNK
jgi:hypothetical protein